MKKILITIYEFLRTKAFFLLRKIKSPIIPQNPENKVYINLGCGLDSSKEFINIDVLVLPNIHYIHDITSLDMLDDESVDLVYASHVVEHIPREKLTATLKEWKRVLKKGGKFRFAVPDFDALIEVYKANNCAADFVRDQVLGQNPPYNNHYTLWNFNKAEKLLSELGFINIKHWSAENIDHHDFKDRASRKMRVGDTEILISLNVEGEKV